MKYFIFNSSVQETFPKMMTEGNCIRYREGCKITFWGLFLLHCQCSEICSVYKKYEIHAHKKPNLMPHLKVEESFVDGKVVGIAMSTTHYCCVHHTVFSEVMLKCTFYKLSCVMKARLHLIFLLLPRFQATHD